MKVMLIATASFALFVENMLGWGDQGHIAIWTVAQAQLTTKARQQVTNILAGDKLAMTAVWLDRAREATQKGTGPLIGDPEAATFTNAFPSNPEWHFVNLPLAVSSYQDGAAFTSENDVVHRLNFCIEVLENQNTHLSKRVALRALIHLVGDIHQPLHCGTGYYDTNNLAHPVLHMDPGSAQPLRRNEDRGGNQLFFGPGKFDELHGLWDGNLVRIVAGDSGSYRELAEVLTDFIVNVNADTSGDVHTWAEQWAEESVRLAKQAYTGLTFGTCTLRTKDVAKRGPIERIEITLPPDYEQIQAETVRVQLAKAAIRLGELLNKILK
ncbi:MAG TPA: S1/P1 nuclease [Verrucomicrobiae bacterium]|nr:S1/P1 nuclease [Verrucomicrobiae bacterium]